MFCSIFPLWVFFHYCVCGVPKCAQRHRGVITGGWWVCSAAGAIDVTPQVRLFFHTFTLWLQMSFSIFSEPEAMTIYRHLCLNYLCAKTMTGSDNCADINYNNGQQPELIKQDDRRSNMIWLILLLFPMSSVTNLYFHEQPKTASRQSYCETLFPQPLDMRLNLKLSKNINPTLQNNPPICYYVLKLYYLQQAKSKYKSANRLR